MTRDPRDDDHRPGDEGDAMPPLANVEAERSVLGSLLLDRDAIATISETLRPRDFYERAHEVIYAAMTDLHGAGRAVDYVTVADELEARGLLQIAGGRGYLPALAAAVPTATHVAHYAGIVARLAARRRLEAAAVRVVQVARDLRVDVTDAVARAGAAVADVALSLPGGDQARPIGAQLTAWLEWLDLLHERAAAGDRVTGVPTGLADLDRMLGGLQPSNLVIVGARPGMGKTSFAVGLVAHGALRAGKKVALFSLEMAADEILSRLAATVEGLDSVRLRSGRLGDDEWARVMRAASALAEADLHIDETPALSSTDLRARVRRLHARRPLDLVVVDYLQLMTQSGHTENRTQEVARVSRDLKALARETRATVVALSQVGRAVETRADHRPLLSDLRESGGIEADADVVLFLYRESVYNADTDPHLAEVIVAKQRNGPTGAVHLHWDAATTRFSSMARID